MIELIADLFGLVEIVFIGNLLWAGSSLALLIFVQCMLIRKEVLLTDVAKISLSWARLSLLGVIVHRLYMDFVVINPVLRGEVLASPFLWIPMFAVLAIVFGAYKSMMPWVTIPHGKVRGIFIIWIILLFVSGTAFYEVLETIVENSNYG